MISLRGVRKRFGELTVLDGIDLEVPEGSVTVLIGPSGGGKSTLLRCVNLLESPQAGLVRVGGLELEFRPGSRPRRDKVLALRRRTGMVFQSFNLFPHRTAVANVVEGLVAVRGWDARRAERRGMELLERIGLAHKADAWPGSLSGGQQQRVAIARALAHSPDVLLCDEPTSALDPELGAEVAATLKALAADGVTMVVATHDFHLAAELAREVVFLERGRVVESGGPTDLFGRPREARTAAFVSTRSGGPVVPLA